MPKAKITTDGVNTKIEVDGVDVSKRVTAMIFQQEAGQPSKLALTLALAEFQAVNAPVRLVDWAGREIASIVYRDGEKVDF